MKNRIECPTVTATRTRLKDFTRNVTKKAPFISAAVIALTTVACQPQLNIKYPEKTPTPSAAAGTPNPADATRAAELNLEAAKLNLERAMLPTSTPAVTPKAVTVEDVSSAVKKALEDAKTPTPAPTKSVKEEVQEALREMEKAKTPTPAPTKSGQEIALEARLRIAEEQRLQAEADAKKAKADAEKAKAEIIANMQAALNAQYPFAIIPVPGQINIYRFPDVRNQPTWVNNPSSSEVNVPSYWNTTIDRTIGPGQIGVISGGSMIIDYSDQNGYGQTLSFPGGSDRVTLAFFLGNPGQYFGRTISARGLVPSHNWVGRYNTPDGNPANQYNWLSLMNAKVAETFGYGGIPGGARYVDVAVIDSNNRLINQYAFVRGGY